MPILDFLRVLLGASESGYEAAILAATDARAKQLLRENGVRFSDAVKREIDAISGGPCHRDQLCVSYYLGMQIGYRAAKRLQP
jgi:hypothetical protein